MLKRLGLAAAAAVALLAAACSSGGGQPSAIGEARNPGESLTRVAEAGGVTVEATWLTEGALSGVDSDLSPYPLERFVLVELQFTTHSGDLSKIDMQQAAMLRRGGSEVSPAAWVSESDDSHHRAGVLVFPRGLGNGPVELTIGLGEKQLALLWEAVPTG